MLLIRVFCPLIDLNNNYIKYHKWRRSLFSKHLARREQMEFEFYTYSPLTYAGIIPPSFSDSIYGGYPGWNQLSSEICLIRGQIHEKIIIWFITGAVVIGLGFNYFKLSDKSLAKAGSDR